MAVQSVAQVCCPVALSPFTCRQPGIARVWDVPLHGRCLGLVASTAFGQTAIKTELQSKLVCSPARCRASLGDGSSWEPSRREMLQLGLGALIGLSSRPDHALAFEAPPEGYRRYADRLDGYSFCFPDTWVQVRGSGSDVFFRNPQNLDENAFVSPSSPSSSKFESVKDLGTPEQAGEKLLKRYIGEFMSTRIGVRRESKLLSTRERTTEDGRVYYEVELNVKSFVNSNQLGVRPEDRIPYQEWNRRYLSVLVVENKRLYEFRLQTPEVLWTRSEQVLKAMAESFRVTQVEGFEGSPNIV